MKLHLPLSLRSALLACLTLCSAAYASTYVATGVNADNVSASNRFYDSGQGVYWLEAGAQPFIGAGVLHTQTGSTEFLGSLNTYIPEGMDTSHIHSDLFAGLTADDKTSWYHATANVIQYWQSYYGVFAQNSATMPYGYTYDPANQQLLGGTQSLNVGMYFYDNWTNAGGDFAMAARWYLTNDHTYTGKGDEGLSELKTSGTAAGYFAPYFASGKDSVVVQDAYSQESLDAAIVNAFGLSAVEDKENTYTQTTPGQIAFIGISCEEASTALTCYGFKTDEKGNVTSLMLAASDDSAYQMFEVYVKEVIDDAVSSVRLYKDAACTELWERGGKGNWYLDAVSYIDTPEVLVDMYNEYNESELTWTGGSSIWKQEADDKSLYSLPDSTSGWTAHAGTGTEFAGEYAAYFTEGRNVIFTSTGAGTIELVGNIEPSRVIVNNDKDADYTFKGEGKLTGITSLSKQGEGMLTIYTANDYSGGTRLDRGTLVAGNSAAFGSGGLELVKGTLALNGNTIGNTIYVSEGAEVTAKNGNSTGDFVLTNAKSYTADNFRVLADSITMTGDKTGSAQFINLNVTDSSSATYRGGYLGTTSLNISGIVDLNIGAAQVTKSYGHLYGGLVYGTTSNLASNSSVSLNKNTVSVSSDLYGGLLYGKTVNLISNGCVNLNENIVSNSGVFFYGGLLYGSDVNLTNNGKINIIENEVNAYNHLYGGVQYSRNKALTENNDTITIKNNRSESTKMNAYGGVFYQGASHIISNSSVEIVGNAVISPNGEALGGAIYSQGRVQIENNDSVLLRGNYEQQGSNYQLRSIYAEGNLELSANTNQNIKIYDSVYTGGNLTLNANKAGGEILLSGAYTEADLLAAKNGVAGTMTEINNSRTNTVVGTTTLGGGT
ncbi:MAG: autotransporter-associated beta strand repeat-containing protein, partial [Akkermansia sp.]|nr:autotransporter-associated beta strand repeat-containing protein [Akkermansia sp.]